MKTLSYGRRLGLSEIGRLPIAQRAFIKEWLTVNFCDEDNFCCELSERADGGLDLEDPDESVGGESEFGVHVLDDEGGKGAFFVLLFEPMPEGCIFDQQKELEAALVIEGEICDVQPEYTELIAQIVDLIPQL